MSPLHSKEPKKRMPPLSVRIPTDLLDEIDAAAAAAEPQAISRHEAILQLLRLGVKESAKPKARKAKK
jgi:metal-responsive CopG/Arc/MetJ family transcriptional regulator